MINKFLIMIILAAGSSLCITYCGSDQKPQKLLYGCVTGDCENGTGTYINIDGSSYKGQWRNSKPHGEGIKTDSDGKKYIGQFTNGKADGTGTLYNSDGTIIREGLWKNGKSADSSDQ